MAASRERKPAPGRRPSWLLPSAGETQKHAEEPPACIRGAVRTGRPYLFHVVVESDPHAFFAAEHLAGHECVEECSARQGQTEIEAKQPPVFHILVELERIKQKVDSGMLISVDDLLTRNKTFRALLKTRS